MGLREELKAVLDKHDCFIAWNCDDCSDTYGIYDPKIEIVANKTEKVLISTTGDSMDASDLAEESP